MDSPYSKFGGTDLILRDELAIDRTLLANERTLLAYLRLGVALLLAGASILHFAGENWFWWLGLLSMPVGIVIGVIGVARFRRMSRSISIVRRQSDTRLGKAAGDA
jgi:putative membrane protein